MDDSSKSSLLLGAHTSAAGGLHNALFQGKEIGATTIQLFTSNQRQWKSRALEEEELQLWKSALQETGLQKIMSHSSYLINLGSFDPEIGAKSRLCFAQELRRCHLLGLSFLNFHPGANTSNVETEKCLDQIVAALLEMQELCEQGSTRLLLETTAGQGSTVGWRFEELAYLVKALEGKIPIGVCIDTCHIFVAGYDLRTREAFEKTLQEFDQVIGLKHLFAFHLNDSVKSLGSRSDRHANLGAGEIGLDCFKFMMQDPKLRDIPKYLETPDGPPMWQKEITMLRNLS